MAPSLVSPFFTSREAMEFTETDHRREECPDLLVSLLVVFHALRLECEKSMELTASSHCSSFFCSSAMAAFSRKLFSAESGKQLTTSVNSVLEHGTILIAHKRQHLQGLHTK